MSRTKDMWLDELERIQGELEDAGVDPDEASERAADLAFGAVQDRYADMADNARQRAKDGL